MKNLFNRKFLTGSLLLVAAILFLVINIASSTLFRTFRLDLTENKLYTLSSGTKEILGEIKEPIIVRLYYSKRLNNINPYLISFAARVQDLLQQYQSAAKGKLVFEVIDPEPFSPSEDEAVNYGLQGVAVDSTGTDFYLGLVVSDSLNAKQVIPFLQPSREQNLEYDISQLIYKLIHPEPKVIGVISALPMAGAYQQRPWAIWSQMEQLFDLHMLNINATEIPSDINTLMLVEPSMFGQETLQAIDKFVMRGGHVLMFIDPLSEVVDKRTAVNTPKGTDNNYLALLRAWGIEFDANKIVADKNLAKTVRAPYEGREVTIRYPLWMDFTEQNISKSDILSSSLERLTFATPGVLSQSREAKSTFTPLVTTTDEAMLIDTDKVAMYQDNLQLLFNEYTPEKAYTIAARINGAVSSAFSSASAPDSNIIVVADTDMLHDHFWLNLQTIMGQDYAIPSASNGNFVMSALDNLSGSNALIGIRNRTSFARPFDTVHKLELDSQQKYREYEQTLLQRMQDTKQKLELLESQKKDGNRTLLSVQQNKEEEAFRQELIETRKELRDVRRKLNHDIEKVANTIKFFTIAFIPILIMVTGLIVWVIHMQRELKSRRATCSAVKH